MADDPYKVLGISRGASDDEVRRAFRRLAKELHPDIKPNDAAAADRFKKVSQAYDILGDAEKRGKYDRGEIDATGEPKRTYQGAGAGPFSGTGPFGGARRRGPGDDLGFGDIFSEMFGDTAGRARGGTGAGFASRGQDQRYTLEVDFLEAVQGARKRVTMPTGGVLDISVPEGVTDGKVLRLKGKGAPGFGGGGAGDALIEIKVRPHAVFERDGDDIRSTVPVALDEAVLGGKIEVETVTGRVQVTLAKGTSSGRTLRLRGKGVRNLTAGTQGDHLVTVQIALPEKIDDSLSYFISEWRQTNRYNPREG